MANFLHKLTSAAAWGLCRLLPVDQHKVVFTSYYGKGYSDNSKAIAEAMLQNKEKMDKKLKFVWLVKKGEEATLPEGIQAVDYQSPGRIRELLTAKVWVDNSRKGARSKRKGQFYLQTWHGLALKRIELDAADKLPPDYEQYARRDSDQTDVMISGSRYMTDIYRSAFAFRGNIEEFGSPRNDCLFADPEPFRARVRQALGLPMDRKLVLYGPTFRADHSVDAYGLDCQGLARALEKRFGGTWTVLVRMHPAVEELAPNLFAYDGEQICNATGLSDIMELLAASDAVVTDYSSLMFDFALTGRPCFQFATDIPQYKNDRNFYFPITDTPFPLATSNEELQQAVLDFDEADYQLRWQKFSDRLGMREDGHASQRCADLIFRVLSGEPQ